jgi:phosphopantothenoylcysteine decarboxylase/phosphopantothenate--cysteine ligase
MTQRILIGIGGGIAAYKVCEVISQLAQLGFGVRVILTQAATEFITPLTAATLSRQAAFTDQDFWAARHHRPLHIELGEWADLILLAPLTANSLGKLAHGLADDLLSNTVLASACPILVAPAMNTTMWQQVAVQRNWHLLQQDDRYHTTGPSSGRLACNVVGPGRMTEPPELITHVQSLLITKGARDLQGKKVLISTGGTREFLDPVRFIGNPSTGKMGIALAEAAKHRGAEVTLVYGTTSLDLPSEMATIGVTSAEQMRLALLEQFPHHDWLLMAAAVSDVRPVTSSPTKLPKSALPTSLELETIPDILAELSQHKHPHQCLVGFAAQTGDILTSARQKLLTKKLDIIAANPIDQPNSGFGSSTNQAIFLDRQGREQTIPTCQKLELAHQLLDFVRDFEINRLSR